MNVRAKLKELWTRVVKVSTNHSDEKVYLNGDGNVYPSEMQRVIDNSPIASRAVNIMAKYISGGAVTKDGIVIEREDLPVVNRKQNLNIADIFEVAARSIAYQKGVFLWRGIGVDGNGDFVGKEIEVLDYKKCRVSKEDGDENAGKVWMKDWENPTGYGKSDARWYYPFSNNQTVIRAQIERDFEAKHPDEDFDIELALKTYRGQVMFLNLTPEYVYPLSFFDSVFNDCDTDFRISLYNNSNTRNGFLGKVIVVAQGIDDENYEKFEKDITGWLGAENSGNLFLHTVDQIEKLDEAIKTIEIKPTFDPDMFENVDGRNRRNILGAANNLPQQLMYASDGALFSAGKDTLNQYKVFYSEQTADERDALVRAVKQLGFDYGIKPIGDVG